MKLLLIGPFPGPINGQTIANQTLCEGLAKKHKVVKINTLKETVFKDKKYQGKFKLIKFLVIFISLFKEIHKMLKDSYDAIYLTPGQSYLGFMRFAPYMLYAIFKKKPYYIHIHGAAFRKVYNSQSNIRKKTINFFLKRVKGVIVLGNSLKFMFKGLVEKEKIFVCENGVQNEFVATAKEISTKLDKMKKDPKQRVLYLSNLMEEKGILDILKATESFSDKEIEFNLAGLIEPHIKDIVKRYLKMYPNKIKFHNLTIGKKKKNLLLTNYVLILPSKDEGQPLSILEAYTSGCAVITDPNIGGISDIFVDKVNGEACKTEDVVSIVKALKKEYGDILLNNYIYGINFFLKDHFIERIEKIISS